MLPGGRQPVRSAAKLSLAVAVAMIRPETIGIVEASSAPLSGIIDSISFNGDHQRLIVSGASDKPLTVEGAQHASS